MLKSLSIKNFALIKELEIAPSENLNIITGETGAGKSIMLGAVGLLLGNRVDTKVLFDQQHKCVIEGTFDVSDYAIEEQFTSNDLDFSSECIIRREINIQGKSRAFVNDTPVTLEILKAIGSRLMDVHSQHDTIVLGSNEYQLSIIDVFAGTTDLLKDYQEKFQNFKSAVDR